VFFSGQKTCKKKTDFSWKTAGTWQRVVGVEVLFIHIHQPHSVGYRGHMGMPNEGPSAVKALLWRPLGLLQLQADLAGGQVALLALLKVAHA